MSAPIALTIAGSDSGGGAGIQADLKAFSARGVYGASVITALTAQNTREVRAILDVPPEFIASQLDAVFEDLDVAAVKIGMLSQPAVIDTVASALTRHRAINIVLDPVMVAKSGDALLRPEAVAALRQTLVPMATLITPNLPEAAVLLEQAEPDGEPAMRAAAKAMIALGARNVLLKGGHLTGAENVDVLYDGAQFRRFSNPRVATRNTHGTGCTLSSAITAELAKGQPLDAAVATAIAYVHEAIARADELEVGTEVGHGSSSAPAGARCGALIPSNSARGHVRCADRSGPGVRP